MKKIKKLENDTISKQLTLEQVMHSFWSCMAVKQEGSQKVSSYFVLDLISFLSL